MIRIPTAYRVDWTAGSWQDNTIGDAESYRLSDVERARLLDDGRNDLRAYQTDDEGQLAVRHPAMDETVTKTTITGINWFKLELLHSGVVEFVCLNEKGVVLPVPRPKPKKWR